MPFALDFFITFILYYLNGSFSHYGKLTKLCKLVSVVSYLANQIKLRFPIKSCSASATFLNLHWGWGWVTKNLMQVNGGLG